MRLRWIVLLCGIPAACTTFDAPPAVLDAGSDGRVVAVGDAGDAAADSTDTGDAGPPGKRIFLSVSSFDGNLVARANALQLEAGTSGAAAADALCTREAKLENLGGARWVAWLSADAVAPIARFNDRGPRYAVSGEQVLRGLGDEPSGPITLPDGGSPDGGEAWTGTESGGVPSDNNCFRWNSSTGSYQGTMGFPGQPTKWSYAGARSCFLTARLYCIED